MVSSDGEGEAVQRCGGVQQRQAQGQAMHAIVQTAEGGHHDIRQCGLYADMQPCGGHQW